ncbi:MAG: single-stranded DNA-binding protein [Gaiellaceae bacterium]
MNVVTLIGNLASEVELKDLGDEKKVATFLLAVDRPTPAGGADFVRIAVWNKQAEACERHLAKGKRVGIDGRLRSRSWEEEGKRRTVVEVVAQRVDFLSGPRRDDGAGAEVIPFEAATA